MTINGIPTSDKNIIAIYNLLLNATLEKPIRTSYLKAATGLNERTIRDRINRFLIMEYLQELHEHKTQAISSPRQKKS